MHKNHNGTCKHFHLKRKLHQTPASLAHTLKLVKEFPSYINQVLFKMLPLHCEYQLVSLCKSQEWCLSFPQSSRSPRCKPYWFSKPDLWWLIFLVQVPWAEEPDMGLGVLASWGGGTSTVVIPLLNVMGHCTRGVGSG